MKRLLTIVAATLFLVTGVAYAQMPEDISQEQIDAALRDLSEIYGSSVVRTDQARAICNQEQYMIECAEIGKRHSLFADEREEEVDAILDELKGKVVEELKQCGNTECLIEVATKIARDLIAENPSLAREVELTPQLVAEKRAIVETAREVGVNFDECRSMDPDTASVELLRACVRLARHEDMQRYIPEEDLVRVEKTENTTALKEVLSRGELDCGDGTLDGCGTFCLNPSASAREAGAPVIPLVCRQIAERFFGPEGVRELERAYQDVRESYDEARRIYEERRYMEREDYPESRVHDEESSTTRRRACAAVEYRPCPRGEYRQESVNELGCFTLGACIPFNTETQKESEPDDRHYTCPSLPTVDSCAPSEEKVITYMSPECGTYYACKPKPEARTTTFPYTFGGGRVVLSFDEARIYCYESGSRGATARGDKKECLDAFGITVPAVSPEKQCAEYGSGWHTMDQSGNCFNESMTEYRTPGGVLKTCAESKVYGCVNEMDERTEPPSGQKEQVWNSLGLRSWIRNDASESRIAELKAACESVSPRSNVWLPGSGTFSSDDFGMPDGEKCRKAAVCSSSQYFNGSECVSNSSSQWCSSSEYWNGSSCVPSSSTTTYGGGGGMKRCFYENATRNSTQLGFSVWCEADYYNCHEGTASGPSVSLTDLSLGAPSQCESGWTDTREGTCPSGQYWNGSACIVKGETVSGSCSSDIKTLLGSGCHSMGNAWFNGAMTLYILPGSTLVKNCTNEKISGCSGSHTAVTCPYDQFWNGSNCVSNSGTICGQGEYWDAGKGACMSSARACTDAKGTWDSSKNICVMPPPPTPTPTPTPTPSPISVPAGQQMQTWNTLGLQSSIRSDADPARIAILKEACASVKSSSNIWMSSAGTYSSVDFGMPDPAKCASAASCTPDQYFDGASCTSTSGSGSGSGGGGGSGMQRCFYPNATINGAHPGYTVWCESDYYNCHVGDPSGASVSLTNLALGAPSSCESGWSSNTTGSECRSQSSQSSCSAVSGCYWYTGNSGSYCDSSGSAASSGTGGGCGMYTSESSCNAMSACEWQSSACSYKSGSTGGSSGAWGSCAFNEYWDTQTSSCRSNENACAEAGGIWDASANYCKMPNASIGGPPLAYLCPMDHEWNGGYCIYAPKTALGLMANAVAAFLSLLGF